MCSNHYWSASPGGTHHVRLPVVGADTLLDTPPEVRLRLAFPREYRESSLGEGRCHLVLETSNRIP